MKLRQLAFASLTLLSACLGPSPEPVPASAPALSPDSSRASSPASSAAPAHAPSTLLQPTADERFELFVLGTAQDGGLPHLGCDGPCCVAARRAGRRIDPACLGIHDRASGSLLLLEATGAIEAQVALLQRLARTPPRGRAPVDAILLTHAHIGHYLGLAQLGREVAATHEVPLWVSARMAAFLRGNQPFRQLVDLRQVTLQEFATGVPFVPLPGLVITPVAVPHRDELSDTHAFVIRGPKRSVLFVPDVDAWDRTPGLLERLLDGVDVAYVDGTFLDGSEVPGRAIDEIPHPLMRDTMARLEARAKEHPGSVRFIHLNHSNRALTDAALQREIEQQGFAVAQTGERVGL